MAFDKKKKYQDTNEMIAGINDVVKANAPIIPELPEAVVGNKSDEVITVSELRKAPKAERRTASITFRITPTVKKKFEELCKESGSSQADMFTFWVDTASK